MGVFQNHLMAAAVAKAAESTDFYTYQIDQSCRLNGAEYLERTYSGSPTSTTTGTLSVWFKKSANGNQDSMFTSGNGSGDKELNFRILDDNTMRLNIFDGSSQVGSIISTDLFRDTSAWYHFLALWDTSQATASNRLKMYINGTQITNLSDSTYPSQDQESYMFASGRKVAVGYQTWNSSGHVKGYLAEAYGIDGIAYTPSTFGETKNGVWIPKDASSSVTFGNGGFYLKFESSGDLGNDSSGNNNDFSPSGLAASDQMKDTPTFDSSSNGGNFCTLNPLGQQGGGADTYTFTEGNLQVAGSSMTAVGTMGITSGKWYYEAVMTSGDSGSIFGWTNQQFNTNTELCYNSPSSGADVQCFGTYMEGGGGDADKATVMTDVGNGSNHTDSSIADSKWSTNDIIGVAFDADNKKVWFSKNGDWDFAYASSDPATAASPMIAASSSMRDYTIKMDRPWLPAVGNWSGASRTYKFNFGTDSSFSGSKTTGSANAADDTGYGDFYYDVPAGFLALCSGNLTTATDPADEEGPYKYYTNKIYTGDGATTLAITGLEFQPDFTWIKNRDAADSHCLFDSSRGVTEVLSSDSDGAESTDADTLKSWTSDGFTVGADVKVNTSSEKYVSWNWKANGGTTTTNDASATGIGTIDSAYQVDTTTGFSIVTYTGTGSSGSLAHGLGAVPKFMIVKARSASGTTWAVYVGAAGNGFLELNGTAAYNSGTWAFDNTDPTSSVFTVNSGLSASGTTYVAYLFIEKEGFSHFGAYVGNANASGTFVCTGFKPRLLALKRTDGLGSWLVSDSARRPNNDGTYRELYWNSTSTEQTGADSHDGVNYFSNGFKLKATNAGANGSGNEYVYIAFAENPLKYAVAF